MCICIHIYDFFETIECECHKGSWPENPWSQSVAFGVFFNGQSIIIDLLLYYLSKDLTLNSKQDSKEIVSGTCRW